MVLNDNQDQPRRRSRLFMLRLWQEDLGGRQTDWRGKVQDVSSGEARYFRDWPALEAFVEGLLRGSDPEPRHPEEVGETGRAS